jgi:hypothetical protein
MQAGVKRQHSIIQRNPFCNAIDDLATCIGLDGGDDGTYRSAENQNAARFSVYPNPVSETCMVNLEKPENGICQIYTLDGKLVLTKTFERVEIVEINTAPLATGLYFLNLEFESGFKSSSKLEVIH